MTFLFFFQFNLNHMAIALQGTKESAGECFSLSLSLSLCFLDLTGDMSACQRTAWPVFQEQETSHILYTSDRSPDSSVTLYHRENKYTNFPEQVCSGSKAFLLAVSDFLVTLIGIHFSGAFGNTSVFFTQKYPNAVVRFMHVLFEGSCYWGCQMLTLKHGNELLLSAFLPVPPSSCWEFSLKPPWRTVRLEAQPIELQLIIHDIILLYLRDLIHESEAPIYQAAITFYKHNESHAVDLLMLKG